MKILVYSAVNKSNIAQLFGIAEYSYYFVLKEFLPILEELATVVRIEDPLREVDELYHACQERGEECVFLSFSPPHKTETGLTCPTIPVLAWEFEDIPSEVWDSEIRNDWSFVLSKLGAAITHSSHSAKTIRKAVRQSYPVIPIAAPVWDRYSTLYQSPGDIADNCVSFPFEGVIVDTRDEATESGLEDISRFEQQMRQTITVQGVLYTTVLNPLDGRKNWRDIVTAFCHALKDVTDATLILKFTNTSTNEWLEELLDLLRNSPKFKCRVLMLNGFLDSENYSELARSTTFTVNASTGEGQCLPLMEYMSAGKPAICPLHTGMEDYVNQGNAFIVESSLEPTFWPDDTRRLYRTYYHRVSWDSLVECYRASYETVNQHPDRYRRMCEAAHEDLHNHCSRSVATAKLRKFLETRRELERLSSLV